MSYEIFCKNIFQTEAGTAVHKNNLRRAKNSSTWRAGIWIFLKNSRIIKLVYKTNVYLARFTSGILLKL